MRPILQIDPDTLVFRRLRVDGFTMYGWVEQTSLVAKFRTLGAAQRRLADDLRSDAARPARARCCSTARPADASA
jgi:hypothetical protein